MLSLYIFHSFYLEGIHEWGHGDLPNDVPVIFCPSWAEFIPYVIYALATSHCIVIRAHRVLRRKLDGLGVPALHSTNVCHVDVQMGVYVLCHSLARDGPHAFRTSTSSFFTSTPPLYPLSPFTLLLAEIDGGS